MVVAGSLTVTNLRRSSPVLWQSRTCDGRRRSSSPVQYTAWNWTELNLAQLNDPVQFSSVFRSVMMTWVYIAVRVKAEVRYYASCAACFASVSRCSFPSPSSVRSSTNCDLTSSYQARDERWATARSPPPLCLLASGHAFERWFQKKLYNFFSVECAIVLTVTVAVCLVGRFFSSAASDVRRLRVVPGRVAAVSRALHWAAGVSARHATTSQQQQQLQ